MLYEKLATPFQQAINAKTTETELESVDRLMSLAIHNASNNRLPRKMVQNLETARELVQTAKRDAYEIAHKNGRDFRETTKAAKWC